MKNKENITNKSKLFLKKHQAFLLFILLMSVFRSAIADWYNIPSSSMMPTIEIGDRITVNKMAYDLRIPFTSTSIVRMNEPKRGEIVVFNSKAANKRLIKRIIALPGDSVSMEREFLTINGKKASYKTLSHTSGHLLRETINEISQVVTIDSTKLTPLNRFSNVTVPKDHYLVLGDNRQNSADSRVYGFVPREELLGNANHVAFSLDYNNYYIPRTNRVFKHL